MQSLNKNMERETPLRIAEEVAYQPGQIVSKMLAQNDHHSLTLFAMPARKPHAVFAEEVMKMLLIVAFPEE